MHEQQQEARNSKEDAIHDPERKGSLQHRTVLVRIQAEGRISADTIVIDGEGEVAVGFESSAVGSGDVAQFVDAGDEGAHEAEIDEGDEEGGVAGGFAA